MPRLTFSGALYLLQCALVLCALAFAIIVFTRPSNAQMPCLPREKAVSILADKHGESQIGAGLAPGANIVVELWSTPDGATFTILLTRPDGKSCMFASGDNWQRFEPVPIEKGDGA